MKKLALGLSLFVFVIHNLSAQVKATNPIIFADVPDMSMIRVGSTYYMSSTTMHMNPGVPIMKSTDLVNWQLVNCSIANCLSRHSRRSASAGSMRPTLRAGSQHEMAATASRRAGVPANTSHDTGVPGARWM